MHSSALSEDHLRADLSSSRKELNLQRESHQETLRYLNDTRIQLCSTKSAFNKAVLEQTKVPFIFTFFSKFIYHTCFHFLASV